MRLEDVRLGMRVRVTSGPYRGRRGEVLEARQDVLHDVITVLLDGRPWPVRFKPDELEPAEDVASGYGAGRAGAAHPGPDGLA